MTILASLPNYQCNHAYFSVHLLIPPVIYNYPHSTTNLSQTSIKLGSPQSYKPKTEFGTDIDYTDHKQTTIGRLWNGDL